MRSACEITRSSSEDLARLSNLSRSAAILYLTPVVIPAGATELGFSPDSDPFEPLGRYMSDYHRGIRHVPYLPAVGLTSTHIFFLREADVVVVVTCQPRSRSPDESLAQQADFAASIIETLDEDQGTGQPTLHVLLQFGQEIRCPDIPVFDNVFWSELYTPVTARQMAHLLFSG